MLGFLRLEMPFFLLFDGFERIKEIINKEDSEPQGLGTVVGPPRYWGWKDRVLSFWVVSQGWSASEWEAHFRQKGFQLAPAVYEALYSRAFVPTREAYCVGVVEGDNLCDSEITLENACFVAGAAHRFRPLTLEQALLVHDKFGSADIERMGFKRLMPVHPLIDDQGFPSLIAVEKDGLGKLWITGKPAVTDRQFPRKTGFVFYTTQ